jgi:dsRNA-specific ribonuclease
METFWKNKLQEYCQAHNLRSPIYTHADRGPDNPGIRFDARCKVESWVTDSDSPSPTKRLADQKAARLMLKIITDSQISHDNGSEIKISVTKLPPIPIHPNKQQDISFNSSNSIAPTQQVIEKYYPIPTNNKIVEERTIKKNQQSQQSQQSQKAKSSRSKLISDMNRDGFPEPQFIFECVVYLPNGKYYRSGEHVNPKEAEEEVAKMALEDYA